MKTIFVKFSHEFFMIQNLVDGNWFCFLSSSSNQFFLLVVEQCDNLLSVNIIMIVKYLSQTNPNFREKNLLFNKPKEKYFQPQVMDWKENYWRCNINFGWFSSVFSPQEHISQKSKWKCVKTSSLSIILPLTRTILACFRFYRNSNDGSTCDTGKNNQLKWLCLKMRTVLCVGKIVSEF
jgi:hypothetical protein